MTSIPIRAGRLRMALCALAASLATVAAQPAAAQHRHHGGWHGGITLSHHHDRHARHGGWRKHHHHHHHHGRGHSWTWVAGSMPYYYPAPVYTYPNQWEPATITLEPAAVPASPPPTQYWYYCDASSAYYPHVQSCPDGWRAVPATPTNK